ncbi:MarR family winged helix-turn-helix transcriptional regulator [Embleya sp. NPDC020630]|uniref:MarR family winged helix-turn-helix transcriptional regulator n=1 Tax=Embleya sp. NPDC020630 TaxID=3363979 RepID=UPI0037A5D226
MPCAPGRPPCRPERKAVPGVHATGLDERLPGERNVDHHLFRGDGATVPDIARRLGLQRQGIQRIADELAAAGLGRYADNPRHRVSKLFCPTDDGRAVLAEMHRTHAAWLDLLITRSPEIDRERLHGELELLVQTLKSLDGTAP